MSLLLLLYYLLYMGRATQPDSTDSRQAVTPFFFSFLLFDYICKTPCLQVDLGLDDDDLGVGFVTFSNWPEKKDFRGIGNIYS